jgi:hypothetical protein
MTGIQPIILHPSEPLRLKSSKTKNPRTQPIKLHPSEPLRLKSSKTKNPRTQPIIPHPSEPLRLKSSKPKTHEPNQPDHWQASTRDQTAVQRKEQPRANAAAPSHPRTRPGTAAAGTERWKRGGRARRPDLGDDVHDAGAVRGAERVDEVADEEGEERHRQPVDDCRKGAHRHHRRVPTVREGEESVHRHRPRASRSPAVAGFAGFRHRSLYVVTALPPPSSGRSLRRGGAMVNAWTGGLLCVFYAEGR